MNDRDHLHPFVHGGGCMSRCGTCGRTFSDPVHGPQPENIKRLRKALEKIDEYVPQPVNVNPIAGPDR